MNEAEMICEKPKKLEDMSYEELLEQQNREEYLFQTYKDSLCDTVIVYEGKKNYYIKSIEETAKTLIKIQDLLWKRPHTDKEWEMNPLMPIKYSPKQRKKLRAFERKVLDKAKEIVNTKNFARVEQVESVTNCNE